MNLLYPTDEDIVSVLKKLQINPADRIHGEDQDLEYTTCRLEELAQYIALYDDTATDDGEKVVLGCYFMECFNEMAANNTLDRALLAASWH